jgi:hypothetical protein
LWQSTCNAKTNSSSWRFWHLSSIIPYRIDFVRPACLALQCFKEVLFYYKKFFSQQHSLVYEMESKIKTLEQESKAS